MRDTSRRGRPLSGARQAPALRPASAESGPAIPRSPVSRRSLARHGRLAWATLPASWRGNRSHPEPRFRLSPEAMRSPRFLGIPCVRATVEHPAEASTPRSPGLWPCVLACPCCLPRPRSRRPPERNSFGAAFPRPARPPEPRSASRDPSRRGRALSDRRENQASHPVTAKSCPAIASPGDPAPPSSEPEEATMAYSQSMAGSLDPLRWDRGWQRLAAYRCDLTVIPRETAYRWRGRRQHLAAGRPICNQRRSWHTPRTTYEHEQPLSESGGPPHVVVPGRGVFSGVDE